MIRIGLRDAKVHFRRFIMSIIAIALGVAFVVGSFCFRAMLNDQVSQMMATNSDADVYIRGDVVKKDHKEGTKVGHADYEDINVDLMDDVRKIDGVKNVSDTHSLSNIVLVGADGNAVTTVGPPTLAVALEKGSWRGATLTDGHWPEADDEIVLHSGAAEQSKLKVGDTTKIVFPDGPRDMKVVGTISTPNSQLGAIIVGLKPSLVTHYRELAGEPIDQTSGFEVYGDLNTPLDAKAQQELADRINAELPKSDHLVAITGDSVRDEETQSTQDQLGFIQPLIMIFAIIALFVGSFIIANTFTMIVRESMRGYALLRSIGASPAQVFLTVIVEAIVLGIVGSVLGVLLGWGMLELIGKGMGQMGMPLTGSPAPSWSDVLVGIIVGIVVTIIGASLPARTAAIAPPIQAMNETVNPEKPVRRRGWIGFVMVVFGCLLWVLAYVLSDGGDKPTPWSAINNWSPEWLLGIGAGLLVIGVIVLGPALVGPAGKVLGWIPDHVFPVTGRLATRNIARAKRRTANTAAALFVGIAIVSCLGVVASSVKTSVHDIVDDGLNADFVLMSASMTNPIPTKALDEIKQNDEVKSLAPITMLLGVSINGGDTMPFASDYSLVESIYPVGNAKVQALKDGEAMVGDLVADENGWKVGDTLKFKAENVVVDEEATAKAQADYQAGIEAQAGKLQAEAQQLAATGDAAGAQSKIEEAHKAIEDAQNVDPAKLVKTKKEVVTKDIRIGAIADDSLFNDEVMINETLADELVPENMRMVNQAYVQAKPGVDLKRLQNDLKKTVKPYYTVGVLNRDEFKSSLSSMVDQVMAILYALLALSIIIAIFGIVNTLALNVSERTKEIGLLRAIGTSRAQIRGMLGIESVIMSVFGTILGIIVGVGAGVVVRAVFSDNGLTKLSIPWDQIVGFLVVSIFVGLLASVFPANRALKKPVLDAVSSE
ncbi:ABC transporter permease [Bifidobacterium gallicum]|uniref:ABC transporter permease n=1 Tax=Bifidobacterium gallicum DSM 20093 = LMG 11596 TaxID=561180 RepID=D1NT08_9BIFI|nr:ABC transporter permease [Bifidobacterium gallicum]EFA23810.1 efflux ABC transporter, permease protein [Bifidobacterium gallicum DSM 20093 = LMG 11596]KFI59187.1 ABC transporter permease [Bifidobacterium gallicum DSM 20093 = LMG 11596]